MTYMEQYVLDPQNLFGLLDPNRKIIFGSSFDGLTGVLSFKTTNLHKQEQFHAKIVVLMSIQSF